MLTLFVSNWANGVTLAHVVAAVSNFLIRLANGV